MERKSGKTKKVRVRQWGGTEDLRIIASISWGCVGDGNGGISQCSSQSNGIYVQHSGLQPGNKCLSFPCTHFDFLSSFNSLSVCHLRIFSILSFHVFASLSYLGLSLPSCIFLKTLWFAFSLTVILCNLFEI